MKRKKKKKKRRIFIDDASGGAYGVRPPPETWSNKVASFTAFIPFFFLDDLKRGEL